MATQIRIPFQGFYQSELDDCLDREFEMMQEDDDLEFDSVDWAETILEVAKEYTSLWISYFGFEGTFSHMSSPREYNFYTDAIIVNFTDNDLVRIKKLATADAELHNFKIFIKETCTSCDGFHSFVENNLKHWPEKWNNKHYQVALLFLESEYNHAEDVIESMQCNGGFELIMRK